jgi:hypothetical protein
MKKLPDTITNESRSKVINNLYAKFRVDKLHVISIEDKDNNMKIDSIENSCYKYNKILYQTGETVTVSDYDLDLDTVCTTGIHYFKSREAAWYWDKEIITGRNVAWYDNGQIEKECNFLNDIYLNNVKQSSNS